MGSVSVRTVDGDHFQKCSHLSILYPSVATTFHFDNCTETTSKVIDNHEYLTCLKAFAKLSIAIDSFPGVFDAK